MILTPLERSARAPWEKSIENSPLAVISSCINDMCTQWICAGTRLPPLPEGSRHYFSNYLIDLIKHHGKFTSDPPFVQISSS